MTLLEAMKSGRYFRISMPKGVTERGFKYSAINGYLCYEERRVDIDEMFLGYDYELEPLPEKKVEITASQFDEAWCTCAELLSDRIRDRLKKELGL